jgi:hypothetical protein
MKIRLLFIVLTIFVPLVLLQAQAVKVNNRELKKVVMLMAGEFSSKSQSKADSAYFHITLKMKPCWKNNKDGYWLYVEQAVASMPDKPYRQRMYHVFIENDTTIASKVYELKSREKYIGAWKNEALLETIHSDSIIDRQGCAILLHKTGKKEYNGSTPGKECLSSLRGATYATSEVTISKDKIVSWDRGWDEKDIQVWGAVKGGYIFLKTKSYK